MATTSIEAQLPMPAREDLRLEDVLQALADPLRLSIVRTLDGDSEPRPCGTLGLPVSKSTASHHFRVLREAGVIEQHTSGRRKMTMLRRSDLDARFAGLLDSVLNAV
jgi:DNA-binding transcriptional ArsR family regulator